MPFFGTLNVNLYPLTETCILLFERFYLFFFFRITYECTIPKITSTTCMLHHCASMVCYILDKCTYKCMPFMLSNIALQVMF